MLLLGLPPAPNFVAYFGGDKVQPSEEFLSGDVAAFQKIFDDITGRADAKVTKVHSIGQWK